MFLRSLFYFPQLLTQLIELDIIIMPLYTQPVEMWWHGVTIGRYHCNDAFRLVISELILSTRNPCWERWSIRICITATTVTFNRHPNCSRSTVVVAVLDIYSRWSKLGKVYSFFWNFFSPITCPIWEEKSESEKSEKSDPQIRFPSKQDFQKSSICSTNPYTFLYTLLSADNRTTRHLCKRYY